MAKDFFIITIKLLTAINSNVGRVIALKSFTIVCPFCEKFYPIPGKF